MNEESSLAKSVPAVDLVPFEEVLNKLGRTAITGWRWRKRGMIQTVDVLGRLYVSRGEIAKFEARAARGEFAKKQINTERASQGSGK